MAAVTRPPAPSLPARQPGRYVKRGKREFNVKARLRSHRSSSDRLGFPLALSVGGPFVPPTVPRTSETSFSPGHYRCHLPLCAPLGNPALLSLPLFPSSTQEGGGDPSAVSAPVTHISRHSAYTAFFGYCCCLLLHFLSSLVYLVPRMVLPLYNTLLCWRVLCVCSLWEKKRARTARVLLHKLLRVNPYENTKLRAPPTIESPRQNGEMTELS